MVNSQLDRHHGKQVKHTGDGIMATFDGPTRACLCGLALRDGARKIGLELRVGVHTGEVEVRGADIGGIAVHVAARVQAHAQPGEVLASRTIPDVVAGSNIRFESRGEHELKGVPGKWLLYAVTDR